MREIQLRTGMPKSSAFDVVRTLLSRGMLREISGRNNLYAPGIQLYLAGSAYPDSQPIIRTLVSRLQEVADNTGHNAYSGIIQDDRLVYTFKYKPQQSILTAAGIGERKDLHCTALGKILIAYQNADQRQQLVSRIRLYPHTEFSITDRRRFAEEIEECRRRGYATDIRENDDYTYCISAAVLNQSGVAEMAVSLSNIWSAERNFEKELEMLRMLAHELSQELGYRGSPVGVRAVHE